MKDLTDIFNENIPFPEDFDMLKGELLFSIKHGQITVKIRNKPGHGMSFYRGTYHPNEVCETSRGSSGPGICVYCGCTLFDSFNDER